MNLKYKHILWDWNGTLINDIDLCINITNRLLERRRYSISINRHIYQQEFTFPVIDFYRKIGFDFTKEDYPQMAEEWISEYKSEFESNSTLNGDVVNVLTEVSGMGLNQSILSACEQQLLLRSVRHLGLESFFEKIHGTGNNEAHGKESLAQRIIDERHCDPHQTLLFGDTVHDYEVAEAVGIDCVLIANGHQHQERLQKTGAHVIRDISFVPDFIKSLQ